MLANFVRGLKIMLLLSTVVNTLAANKKTFRFLSYFSQFCSPPKHQSGIPFCFCWCSILSGIVSEKQIIFTLFFISSLCPKILTLRLTYYTQSYVIASQAKLFCGIYFQCQLYFLYITIFFSHISWVTINKRKSINYYEQFHNNTQ